MITWTKIGEGNPLPSPNTLDEEFNPYYLIYTKYGASQAMYIKDKDGNCKWYGNYEYEVITEVLAWCKINKPQAMDTLANAKLQLYLELIKIDTEIITEDEVEIMYLLAKDDAIQIKLNTTKT